MGSPITSWENVAEYFTGAGTASVGIIFTLAVAACVGALLIGAIHESHSYSKM